MLSSSFLRGLLLKHLRHVTLVYYDFFDKFDPKYILLIFINFYGFLMFIVNNIRVIMLCNISLTLDICIYDSICFTNQKNIWYFLPNC